MNNPLSFLRYVITILFLCDNHKFDETKNKKTLVSAVRFMKDLQRFDEQPF